MTAPTVTYLLPSGHGYVAVDEHTASIPVRLSRLPMEDERGAGFTYGEYFHAISSVLAKNKYHPLIGALADRLKRHVSPHDITDIRIFAEKHGSDYHPARVEVCVGEERAVFVMNVAATERGWSRLHAEFHVLEMLAQKYGHPYLPKVFFKDDIVWTPNKGNRKERFLAMFLGEWFEKFHEFHTTGGNDRAGSHIVLWDTHNKDHVLSRNQSLHIYKEAAKILTLYYDAQTFEQIYPWHHASGDFVASVHEAIPEVRLITARHYGAMLSPGEGVPPEEGLLFFLLNLSLRMRLDRVDGTGPLAWANPDCIDATIQGFTRGIEVKEQQGQMPHGIRKAFFDLCLSLGRHGISERCHALVDACDPRAPDIPILQKNLNEHAAAFFSVLHQ